MRLWPIALVSALAALSPAPALALPAGASTGPRAADGGLSLQIGAEVGWLTGTASELVFGYPAGAKFKASELTWDLRSVAVAGVRVRAGLGRRFFLDLGYWSALGNGGAALTDLDWMYQGYFESGAIDPASIDNGDWTHRSDHPDTTLDDATRLDVALSVLALQSGRFSVSALVGYRRDDWRWSARGGTGVYTPFLDGGTADLERFRSWRVVFPADRGILYEQTYKIPYLGVGVGWSDAAFAVEGRLVASVMVEAADSDLHQLRDTLFVGEFSGGSYVAVGARATWAFSPRWSASLGAEHQRIPVITGDFTLASPEGRGFYQDAGGVALQATMVTLGAACRF